MGLSKPGSPQFQAEQHAMRVRAMNCENSKPNKVGWVGTEYNANQAGNGYGAVMVGQTDNPEPHKEPETAAIDTIAAVLHWLGSQGMTDQQIANVVRLASGHYATEKDGSEG